MTAKSASIGKKFGNFGKRALLGVFLAASSAAVAADLPAVKDAPPAPAAVNWPPIFIKAGFTYALNTSASTIYAQDIALLRRGVTTAFNAGISATLTDVATLGFETGLYLTPNVSLNVSGGLPFFIKDKTKGYNPANPAVPNGTVLAKIMPAIIPVTLVYHFTNFGAFQPYIGAGPSFGFSFSNQNAFLYTVNVGTSVGFAAQAGFDYMIDDHWGVSLDVKKSFNYVESSAAGALVPGVGAVPTKVYQHTFFQPWLFSVGLLYRFGGPDAGLFAAKY
jgi:outer membrane protein